MVNTRYNGLHDHHNDSEYTPDTVEVQENIPEQPTQKPKFALAPALISDQPIDYNKSSGIKIYQNGITSLTQTPFNMDPNQLMTFLSTIKIRLINMGWSNIFNIPEDADNNLNRNVRNILERFGEITMEQINKHVKTYLAYETRYAQNSSMLYHAIINSITEEELSKITIFEETYILII